MSNFLMTLFKEIRYFKNQTKADTGDHFDEIEKFRHCYKIFKTNLKTPRDARGVKMTGRTQGSIPLYFLELIFSLF